MADLRLAHVFNFDATAGGNVSASNLMAEWEKHGVEAWGVHATNTGWPETFVTDELDYPLVFPSRLPDGIKDIDPDVVLVHGYSPALNQLLREELGDDDAFDAPVVLRKGMNLLEHWLGQPSTGNTSTLTHQFTALGWYDHIVCPTRHAAERLATIYGEDCPPLSHIPNGIDRSNHVPSSYMAEGVLRVMTASRVAPNNYVLSPMLAVARLIEEGYPIRMNVYGAANGPLDGAVRSLAEGYADITVHGRVSRRNIIAAMDASDVVCVPSFSHQAVPLAAVEGMASGNLVLASFPEAAEEEALITVPATEPNLWREAFVDAIDDPEDAKAWIRTGIERAKVYDVERVVREDYLPVLRNLADTTVCRHCGRSLGNAGARANHEPACESNPAVVA